MSGCSESFERISNCVSRFATGLSPATGNEKGRLQHLKSDKIIFNYHREIHCFILNKVMRAYHSPQSDFTYPRRQSQTLVWVDNRLVNTSSPVFHSEVVSKTDSSIRKLDEKKQTLEQIVHILSGKLENKMRRRRHRSCRSESGRIKFIWQIKMETQKFSNLSRCSWVRARIRHRFAGKTQKVWNSHP